MALAGANITLSFNPKPLSFSTTLSSPSLIKLGSSRLTSRSHRSVVKCSSEHTDGGELKKALSSLVGEKVEELLNREENKPMLDRLNKAANRVELAKRELEEIEKQEAEAKKTKEYIELMEARVSEIAEVQRDLSNARAMIDEAERSLLMNMDEFAPLDDDVIDTGEINRDGERLESVKAASISAIFGTLAELPISTTQVSSGAQLLLPLVVTFASCALFGVTFRYAVRRDLDNIQLKTGTAAAFAFVKGLGTLDGGLALELNTESFISHCVDGVRSVSQNLFIFVFAAVALDFCFKIRLLSPFPMRRSIVKAETKT